MKCMKIVQVPQRSENMPGETQEEPGRESPHSACNLQVKQAPDPHGAAENRWGKWLQVNEWL